MRWFSESGQAAVEAAFALPLLMAVLGLLAQPAVLLYDQGVMNAAAAEGCRMLETQTISESSARAYVLRRLSAVPEVPAFHEGGASGWDIEFEGGELSEVVSVRVSHSVRPLPLLGVSAGLVTSVQPDGTVVQDAQAQSSLQPGWAVQLGSSPEEWMETWE